MGSRSRDKGGGECWGPGGRTFVTPLRYTNCSSEMGQLQWTRNFFYLWPMPLLYEGVVTS